MPRIETPFDDSQYPIWKGQYWNTILHRDQPYLGQMIVYLTTRVTEDFISGTNREEKDELFDLILPGLNHSLDRSFQPVRINLAHLANTEHFSHWHVVPRYKDPTIKVVEGFRFEDRNPSRHYAPATPHNPPPAVMRFIHRTLITNLPR